MKSILFTFLLAGTSLLSMANGGTGSGSGNSFASGNGGNGDGTTGNTSASSAEVKYIAGKDGERPTHQARAWR